MVGLGIIAIGVRFLPAPWPLPGTAIEEEIGGPSTLEADLYPPIKRHLERLGLEVKGEVRGCDLLALSEGTPELVVIGEMKQSFTRKLLLQAVDRTSVRAPNSATCRTMSTCGTSAASWPSTALAMTRPMSCASPPSSRSRQCLPGSSAHQPKVQRLSRSNRT